MPLVYPLLFCFQCVQFKGGKKEAPALKAGAKLREEKVLPLPKKIGPAQQKFFSLFTAYLGESHEKMLKLICIECLELGRKSDL